jgi:hypothetical protein
VDDLVAVVAVEEASNDVGYDADYDVDYGYALDACNAREIMNDDVCKEVASEMDNDDNRDYFRGSKVEQPDVHNDHDGRHDDLGSGLRDDHHGDYHDDRHSVRDDKVNVRLDNHLLHHTLVVAVVVVRL